MNYWNEPCDWAPVQYKIELCYSKLDRIAIPGVKLGYIEYRKQNYAGLVHFTEKVPLDDWPKALNIHNLLKMFKE